MKRSLLVLPVLLFFALAVPSSTFASSFTFTRSLSLGSSGTDVTYLQVLLGEYHYLNATPTGYFGPATAAAVAFLQQVNHIPAVGTVGQETRTLLNAAEASGSVDNSSVPGLLATEGNSATAGAIQTTNTPTPTTSATSIILRPLSIGSVGGDVTLLQETLATLGYLNVQATGYFGALTQEAVIKFQEAEGLAPVGSVGPITRGLINNYIAVGPTSPSTTTTTSTSGSASSGGTPNTPVPTTPTTPISCPSNAICAPLPPVVPITPPITNPTPTPTPNPTPSPTPNPPLLPAPGTPSVPSPNGFANIAAGCAVPTVSSSRQSFYIDAVNGSDTTGDGSSAHPWKTLSTVLTSKVSTTDYLGGSNPTSVTQANQVKNPAGPVHSGDIIYLMNGNYGDITVMGVNSDFITIAAAPGQTPVLATLNVVGASKWIFQGLKIQSLSTGLDTYKSLVSISSSWNGPVNNIIFDHNSVSSADSTAGWSQAQWQSQGMFRGINMDGGTQPQASSCVTVTNNQISNVLFGIGMSVNNSLYEGNTLNNFGDDGLDYAANNLVISHNLITNNNDVGDGNHEDAMQGQIGRGTAWSNVTIDSNTVIRQTCASCSEFPTYLQGIDAFDNDWTNLVATNNIVITNAYHGLSFSSVHGGLIANNTVLFDGSMLPAGSKGETWIDIGDTTHEGSPTNNVIVRNNISSYLVTNTTAAEIDDNIAGNIDLISPSGVESYNSKPGVYGSNNIIASNLMSGFVNFNPTNWSFDVHLLSTSPALGIGNPLEAPAVDISGTPRVAPIAAGAYTSIGGPLISVPITPPVTTPIATTTAPVIPPTAPLIPIVTAPLPIIPATTPSTPTKPTPTPTPPTPTTPIPIITVPVATPAPSGSGETFHMTFEPSTISGTTITDQSGTGLSGTLVNGPTSVSGKIGGALAFNGTNQGVSVPASLSQLGISGNQMTVSAWFYNTDTTNPAQTIVTRGYVHSSASGETFNVLAHDYANRPDASFSDGTNILVVSPSSTTVLSTNTWYNVVAVLNGQTGSLYLNGSLIAATTSPSFGALKDVGRGALGIGYDALGSRYYFTGDIDDVQIYNRALSASEISGIANGSLAIQTGSTNGMVMPISKTLVAGAAGADVSALQELLKSQGYFTYPVITGKFAQITKSAVTAFQKAHNIDPIGLVGPVTRSLLNSLAGVGASFGF